MGLQKQLSSCFLKISTVNHGASIKHKQNVTPKIWPTTVLRKTDYLVA